MPTYFGWRPFCGGDLIVYALELLEAIRAGGAKGEQARVWLLDLYRQVAAHALERYGVVAPERDVSTAPRQLVRDIVSVSCRVRASERWKREVTYVTDTREFADLLKEAFDYAKDAEGGKVQAAKRNGIYVAHGCHTDGSLFLERHSPNNDDPNGPPRRRVFFFVGVLHHVLCDFLTRYGDEHSDAMYALLLKAMGHGGNLKAPATFKSAAGGYDNEDVSSATSASD